MSVPQLEAKIGYTFKNKGLLQQALTHRSCGSVNNEVLEFMGDSVLGMASAHMLYVEHPDDREGVLSRLRAQLVCEAALNEVGRKIGIPKIINLGPGERKAGCRDSIIADAVEAIIGAVMIDGGMDSAVKVATFILSLVTVEAGRPLKDSKTFLQELLQEKKLPLPEYIVIEVIGPEHHQTFKVSCKTPFGSSEGTGVSRRAAEQDAAKAMIDSMVAKVM